MLPPQRYIVGGDLFLAEPRDAPSGKLGVAGAHGDSRRIWTDSPPNFSAKFVGNFLTISRPRSRTQPPFHEPVPARKTGSASLLSAKAWDFLLRSNC
jgi:hypothetical protein